MTTEYAPSATAIAALTRSTSVRAGAERDRLREDLAIRGGVEFDVPGGNAASSASAFVRLPLWPNANGPMSVSSMNGCALHDDRRTGRRVARVSHRDEAVEPAENLFVEDAGQESHLAMAGERRAVADRNAGAFLSAMLQRVQGEVYEPRHIEPRSVDGSDTAHTYTFKARGRASRPAAAAWLVVARADPEKLEQRDEDIDRVEVDRHGEIDRSESVAAGADATEVD